jgi:thioredoxin-related protein
MKHYLVLAIALLLAAPAVSAKKKVTYEIPKETEHINWMSMDDLQYNMKKKPKKVFMDIYTDWCGWCKRMEATTFSNPEVVKYMNENYYCVRFNAERRDTFRFMGKSYFPDPEKKANTLAVELMRGKLSYPTFIIMEELFQNPQPVAGYMDAAQIEPVLKFFGSNSQKTQRWEDFQKGFHGTWTNTATAEGAPAGH